MYWLLWLLVGVVAGALAVLIPGWLGLVLAYTVAIVGIYILSTMPL